MGARDGEQGGHWFRTIIGIGKIWLVGMGGFGGIWLRVMGQTEGIPDGWVWRLWLLAVGGIWGIWLSAVGWVGEHLADCAWVQGESDSVTWVGLGGGLAQGHD